MKAGPVCLPEAVGGRKDVPMAEQSPYPAIHHHEQAAAHLRRAADYLDKAIKRRVRNEHASAAELAKAAQGHIGEAQAHMSEAQRLHAAHEAHGSGSHWNAAPEPRDEGQRP
jgi:hypothetical protein